MTKEFSETYMDSIMKGLGTGIGTGLLNKVLQKQQAPIPPLPTPPSPKPIYIEESNIGVCIVDNRVLGTSATGWAKAITIAVNGEYYDVLLDNGFVIRLGKTIAKQMEAAEVLTTLAEK